MRIETAISTEYVPHWGIVEALREILQEAFDTRTKYNCNIRFHRGKNKFIIEDDGLGISTIDLALGKSSKRDDDNLIGQFGEGLKLAMLVVARLGREMIVDTVGYRIKPEIIFSKALGCEVLAFNIRSISREVGTRFEIECTPEEVEQAKQYFKELRKEKMKQLDPVISLPGGKVFINGVLATEIPNLLFSYNFQGVGKEAQNRDRTVVDMQQLEKMMRNALEETQSKKVITYFLEKILEMGNQFSDYVEGRISIWPQNRELWGSIVMKLFQNKCLSYNTKADNTAEYLGFQVLDLPWTIQAFLERIGVPYSQQIIEQKFNEVDIPFSCLDEQQKEMFRIAKSIVEKIVGPVEPVKLTQRCYINKIDCGNIDGFYDRIKDTIYLTIEIFSSIENVTMTLLHEALHKHTKTVDSTREFEMEWQNLVKELLFGELHFAKYLEE